jgi:hypothetical protein
MATVSPSRLRISALARMQRLRLDTRQASSRNGRSEGLSRSTRAGGARRSISLVTALWYYRHETIGSGCAEKG